MHGRIGNAWPQCHMRPTLVIVPDPSFDLSSEVVFRQGNEKVKTTPAQTANRSFADTIGLGCSRWRFQNLQAQIANGLIQRTGENAIAIMDEKAVGMIGRYSFA